MRVGGDDIAMLEERVPTWDRQSSRVIFEQTWIKNLAYFAGKQHFALIGNQLVEIPADEHEIRYKANYIKPAVLRSVSKLLNMNGRFACAPQNGSPRSREIARTSDAVFDHQRTVTDYVEQKTMAYLWAANCGTAFIRNLWDPSKGDPDRFYWQSKDDKRVKPVIDMSADERVRKDREMEFDDLSPGEVTCEASSPFQIYPDRACRDRLANARHITQAGWVSRDIVAEAFNVDIDDVPLADASAAATRYEEALAYMTTGSTGGAADMFIPTFEFENRTWLRQYWERPSRKYPKGRYVAAAGELVLRSTDNPYIGDKSGALHLPFVKIDWIPMPGRFWGLALVDDLTSPQFRHNESRARMFEFERIHGRVITFVPKGSGVPPGELTLRNGGVYEFNAQMGAIQFSPAPQLPKEVAENAMICKSEIADLSAGGDVDGAKMPAQLRSGEAVQQMLAEKDIILSVTSAGARRSRRRPAIPGARQALLSRGSLARVPRPEWTVERSAIHRRGLVERHQDPWRAGHDRDRRATAQPRARRGSGRCAHAGDESAARADRLEGDALQHERGSDRRRPDARAAPGSRDSRHADAVGEVRGRAVSGAAVRRQRRAQAHARALFPPRRVPDARSADARRADDALEAPRRSRATEDRADDGDAGIRPRRTRRQGTSLSTPLNERTTRPVAPKKPNEPEDFDTAGLSESALPPLSDVQPTRIARVDPPKIELPNMLGGLGPDERAPFRRKRESIVEPDTKAEDMLRAVQAAELQRKREAEAAEMADRQHFIKCRRGHVGVFLTVNPAGKILGPEHFYSTYHHVKENWREEIYCQVCYDIDPQTGDPRGQLNPLQVQYVPSRRAVQFMVPPRWAFSMPKDPAKLMEVGAITRSGRVDYASGNPSWTPSEEQLRKEAEHKRALLALVGGV